MCGNNIKGEEIHFMGFEKSFQYPKQKINKIVDYNQNQRQWSTSNNKQLYLT